jgi:hypothetical protein
MRETTKGSAQMGQQWEYCDVADGFSYLDGGGIRTHVTFWQPTGVVRKEIRRQRRFQFMARLGEGEWELVSVIVTVTAADVRTCDGWSSRDTSAGIMDAEAIAGEGLRCPCIGTFSRT